MTSNPLSSDFSYKKYSLEQLDNWVNDAVNCEDLTPQDIYDTVLRCVEESVKYHKKYYTKSVELLSLLKGHREVDFDASTKDKEREYNLREAEYYTKRAELDAKHVSKVDGYSVDGIAHSEYYYDRERNKPFNQMKSETSQKDWNDFWENSATLNSSDC